MAIVYILAQSPWGPVQLRTGADAGEVLRSCGARGSAPAKMIDVGGRDPAEMVRMATRTMQPAGAGWFAESVAKAANLVAGAVSEVPAATVVAETSEIAVHGHPAAIAEHVEAASEGGAANPEFSEATRAGGCEAAPMTRNDKVITRAGEAADYSATTANDSIPARVRRRPGAEVDARAIRVGLGMSQPAFAKAFGIPLATLRDWEQGRSRPEGTGCTLLAVIEARPDAVRQAVEGAGCQ